MKGTDLREAVYNLTKDRNWSSTAVQATDSVVNDLVINWVNLALEEFPPEALTNLVYPVSDITAGEADYLPEDFNVMAYLEDYDTDPSTRYEADEVEITLDGTIIYPVDIVSADLYYYPKISFDAVTEELPLIPRLQGCLVYFMYAQYYYQSGEGDTEEHRMADNYLSRFNNLKKDKLMEAKNQGASDAPAKVTDSMPSRSKGRQVRSSYYE